MVEMRWKTVNPKQVQERGYPDNSVIIGEDGCVTLQFREEKMEFKDLSAIKTWTEWKDVELG